MAKALRNLLLLGVLTACTPQGHWKHAYLNTGTEFSSSKLAYVFPDPHNSIHLEILRSETSCTGYLFVHSHPIASVSTDPKKALVSLQVGDNVSSFLAIRHEGGHRLLLPEDMLEKVLLALSQDQTVLLETSGYKAKLSPEGFSRVYAKFQNPSKFPRLIQLPL